IDEAYFDYVTDPDHDTHIPIAVENPHVAVARTFSKAYGMAGLRMGYAIGHPDTVRRMADWDAGSGTRSLNVLAMRAGIAAIPHTGKRRPSTLGACRQLAVRLPLSGRRLSARISSTPSAPLPRHRCCRRDRRRSPRRRWCSADWSPDRE